MASRRRRRQSIGKVVTSVENKVRRLEKRPGAKRLKNSVVTTEKIKYRAVNTKAIEEDAVTPNETSFGTTFVTDTQPVAYLKEGTTWVNPNDGATAVYSTDLSTFITVTDATAQAAIEGKNSVFRQDDAPTGGTYVDGDLWIDTNDGNKMYVWNGSSWVSAQDFAIATAQSTANGKNTVHYSTSTPGSTANTAGDIWWQYSGGVIIAQYTGAGGTSWTQNTLGNAVIANLDAGKITTGLLNVAGTVKIATGTTGARVEITPSGFFAYNSGNTPTVQILASDGSAYFSGNVASSTITGSTLSTGNSGNYITISSLASNQIKFFATGQDSSYPGLVYSAGTDSTTGTALYMQSPRVSGSSRSAPYINMYQSTSSGNPNFIIIQAGDNSSGSSIQLGAPTYAVNVQVGGTGSGSLFTVYGDIGGDIITADAGMYSPYYVVNGAVAENISAARNIHVVQSGISSGGSSSGYQNGAIVLVREG